MSRISRECAESIAKSFIEKVNPENWDGIGDRPSSVDERIVSYTVPGHDCVRLDISLESGGDEDNNGEWVHYCELVETGSNCILEAEHGYGTNSYLNLADTIMDLI